MAFNGSSGEFAVTPDPLAAGVEPGDALIIRAQPPGVCPADSISDSTFQDGFRAEDSLTYDFSFTADNAEVNRGLKDLGDLLEDLGDPNATNIQQFAANIGVAIHGLYDVRADKRKWV